MSIRVPPQNIEAEQSILGGLMLDPESWDAISDAVAEADFYKASHKKIFAAINELVRRNDPVDIITVSNFLTDRKEIEAVGGPAYLAELINQTPSSANISTYAKIVHEKAVLRKLISTCTEVVEKSYDQEFDNLEVFLDQAEGSVFAINQVKKTQGLVRVGEIVKTSLEQIEELYNRKAEITGISSGFRDMDKMTAGFHSGELIIVAARPSMGKTAFGLNIALHAALREKKAVAFFSVEMAKEACMMRMLASESRINISDIKIGRVADGAWAKLINAAASLSDSKLYMDDTSGLSPFEIRAKCRRLKAQGQLDMIIIDYLQIMDLKQKVESRERAVSEISRNLKAIAKELQIPVIALAQLNRGVEGRSDRRPMLSDLRESGAIEQDADVIMMIFREDYYDREAAENKGVAEIIIGKQRNGPTGTVKLSWSGKYGIFSDLVDTPPGAPDVAPVVPPNPHARPRNFAPA